MNSKSSIFDSILNTIESEDIRKFAERCIKTILVCITKISTFLILCDLAVCLATLYVSFSLVFALMRYRNTREKDIT